jgi:hypothetical protein
LDFINTQIANCLWNDFEGHRKLHLANRRLVWKNKEFGALGILDLANLNLYLLGFWIKRYAKDERKTLEISSWCQVWY